MKARYKKSNNKLIIVVAVILAIMILPILWAWGGNASNEKTELTIETSAENLPLIEVIEDETADVEIEFPMTMGDYLIEDAIHGMSHQKVDASEKWSMIPLTMERVERLIVVIENGTYENGAIYLSILNRWKEKDFSQVDEDHNQIWTLQGGTVGEAYGILSADQERDFIEQHYDIKE